MNLGHDCLGALYHLQYLVAIATDDQERWEAEVEDFEKRFPHYRSYLAQKHQKKLNVKGAIDIKLTQLGIKKPCTARHFFIKEQVEVSFRCGKLLIVVLMYTV